MEGVSFGVLHAASCSALPPHWAGQAGGVPLVDYRVRSIRASDAVAQGQCIHADYPRRLAPLVKRGGPASGKAGSNHFDDAYEDLVTYALPVLRKHGFPATVFVPTAYVGRSNVWDHPKGSPVMALMSADAIREWADKAIEFGAHSHTHPELDALDPVALEEELEGSREELERIINAPVTSFAYPYGNYNSDVRAAVGRKFELAFTTENGVNTLGTDLLRLHRTMVKPGQSMLHFASRLRFGRSIPEDLRRKLRDKLW
jgi:hypothetical protein